MFLYEKEAEAYLGLSQTPKMKWFALIVSFNLLTVVAKLSILDVSGIPGYASEKNVLENPDFQNFKSFW